MACGGCAERGAAMKATLLAIAKGDGEAARREADKIVQSASRDLNAMRRAASVRLGLRR